MAHSLKMNIWPKIYTKKTIIKMNFVFYLLEICNNFLCEHIIEFTIEFIPSLLNILLFTFFYIYRLHKHFPEWYWRRRKKHACDTFICSIFALNGWNLMKNCSITSIYKRKNEVAKLNWCMFLFWKRKSIISLSKRNFLFFLIEAIVL